jgi:hypothetical protein
MKRVIALSTVMVLGLAAGLSVSAPLGLAQDKHSDPFAGTWKLNIAKSKYNAGTPPKSEVRTYEAVGEPVRQAQGEKLTVHGVAADGSAVEWGYTVRFDGKYYPITGAAPGGADAIAVKRVSARKVEATLAKTGKPIETANRVVSDDGRTMTATAWIVGASGPPIFVIVYDKQ